ncbi:hypothetical protein Pmani_038906 [Petrolisthes manimaculis]|uniref:Uncharacterized protein n=1 Tax=Petrolisthes manimaculis TaxID=1843537 RepID=A0AAE1NEQ7_9EUCA|nr:hypothetical protein Pmani_038906 [Petrolisthes manimaculis]
MSDPSLIVPLMIGGEPLIEEMPKTLEEYLYVEGRTKGVDSKAITGLIRRVIVNWGLSVVCTVMANFKKLLLDIIGLGHLTTSGEMIALCLVGIEAGSSILEWATRGETVEIIDTKKKK